MKISRLSYNSLMCFLIRGCFIGISLNNITYTIKQDSFIAMMIAFLIGFIPLALYLYIRNFHPEMNIAEKNRFLFGEKIGKFINILCVIFAFNLSIIILSDLTHFVSSQFLYYTSTTIIATAFMIAIVYALTKGIKAIAKSSLIIFYFVMLITLIIIIGLTSSIDLNNFKPILYNGITPVIKSSLVVLAYNVMPIYFLLIIPKNNVEKDSTKLNIIFYIISMFSIISVGFLTIAIFGRELSRIYEYPGFHLLRQVNIGEFADRIEAFLSIEWVVSMCIMLIFCLYFCNQVLEDTFKYNKKWHFPISILEAIILIILQMYVINSCVKSSIGDQDVVFYSILISFILLFVGTSINVFVKKLRLKKKKYYNSSYNSN